MLTAVGLMSGTSADGVSAAAVRIGPGGLRLLAYRTFPFPRPLRRRVLGASQARAPELSDLHGELGKFFAGAAARFIGKGRVDLIGSHGQTVWHQPARHTLQLGEAAHIAERTGVTTVCDFRPADIAAGGHGAPLVPYFDWYLWGGRPVVLLNVGGIANLTRVGRSLKDTSGFDTGPGNCLIDEAMAIAFGRPYDEGGRVVDRPRGLQPRVPP